MKRQIAILGSTGSIGTQALEVIKEHSDLYEVYCLTANNQVELLARQAHEFKPAAVVIANETRYDELKRLMSDLPDVKVYAGAKAEHTLNSAFGTTVSGGSARLAGVVSRKKQLLPAIVETIQQ